VPIEIKELVIRTVVDKNAGAAPREAQQSPSSATGDAGAVEQIVQECVRQVMRILANNRER
jgi:hypothetical protein